MPEQAPPDPGELARREAALARVEPPQGISGFQMMLKIYRLMGPLRLAAGLFQTWQHRPTGANSYPAPGTYSVETDRLIALVSLGLPTDWTYDEAALRNARGVSAEVTLQSLMTLLNYHYNRANVLYWGAALQPAGPAEIRRVAGPV